MPRVSIIFCFCILLFFSCSSIQDSSKFEFQSAKYYTSVIPKSENKVYIDITSDTIKIFELSTSESSEGVAKTIRGVLTEEVDTSNTQKYNFFNPALDIDFLTIPLKYRFPISGVPNQLTTNFNGVVYLGFRNDIYRITYEQNPLQEWKRRIKHFGTSLGGFAGLSSEPVNPWVTNENVEIEYDAAVFSTGISWIVGIDNLSAGLSLGFDYLLDRNRKFWIYQGKPWLGVAFGINLN